jgi:hypothetical protein
VRHDNVKRGSGDGSGEGFAGLSTLEYTTERVIDSELAIVRAGYMKFFRYRRPSLKTMLGVTKAKKQLNKALGINKIMAPFRWWPNQKRRIKRKLGYESDLGRLIRHGAPRPGGCLLVLAAGLAAAAAAAGVVW